MLFRSLVPVGVGQPGVRLDQVRQVEPDAGLADADWHEIIDVAHWWRDRDGFVGDVPVIGRHGRADAVKWPLDPEEILRAYPASGGFRVRVLGGGEIAVRRLGHRPDNWDVVPFGAESPEDFLRTIDFFVYFHDPDLVEAFGRTILEAMASGVPVIVGPHFRAIFGEAALYCEPAGVREVVRRLHFDRDAYDDQVERARRFVADQFGSASHIARLASLGAMPRGGRPPQKRRVRITHEKRRVLMVGDDVARFRAIARRLPKGLEAVVVGTASLAEAHAAGLLTE